MAWDQNYATQWGVANGLLKQGQTATGGALINAANAAGRSGDLNAAIAAANANPAAAAPGVQPLSTAPLTDWQKSGLTNLSAPATAGNEAYGTIPGQMDEIKRLLGLSTVAMTPDKFNSDVSSYMTPYADQVINPAVARINDAAAEARNRILGSQGKIGRLGDSPTAIQESQLDKNTGQQIAETTGNLLNTGFNNAANLSKGFYDTNVGATNTAANIASSLPATSLAVGNTLRSNQIDNARNTIGAGTAVQAQNQSELDAYAKQFAEQNGYPLSMVKQLADILKLTPSTGFAGSTVTDPSTADRAGAIAGSSSVQDLISKLIGGGSSLPWQAAGNVNPLGGYY